MTRIKAYHVVNVCVNQRGNKFNKYRDKQIADYCDLFFEYNF